MPKEIFYDTETSGFPSTKIPWGHEDQPDVLQFGLIARNNGRIVGQCCFFVETTLLEIPAEALSVHNITPEIANASGMSYGSIVSLFNFFISRADRRIAHNEDFDWKMMQVAAARAGIELAPAKGQEAFCTQKNGAAYNNGTWPKLKDAHRILCGSEPEVQHNAMADTISCMHVYDELIKREEVPA